MVCCNHVECNPQMKNTSGAVNKYKFLLYGEAIRDFYYLCCLGEHLTETELVEHLMTVMGFSENPEVDGSYSEESGPALEELPNKISAAMFAEELLGLSTQ